MGVGFGEMLLIAGIALVVIGPEKFPEFVKIVLRTFRDLRGYVEDAKRDIGEELRPVKREIQQLSRYNPEDYLESLADSVTRDNEKADDGKRGETSPSAASSEGHPCDPARKDGAEKAGARTTSASDNSQNEFWADVNADSDNSEPASSPPEDMPNQRADQEAVPSPDANSPEPQAETPERLDD